MAGIEAQAIFETLMDDAVNQSCFDSGVAAPTWASISHGIFLGIGAAGIHRSLGVRVSRVQSVEMDAWKPLHLKMMELGGNRRFREFLREHGIPEDMPIRDTYNTRAAEWYRRNLLAEAEGSSRPSPMAPGEGALPVPGTEVPSELDKVFVDVPAGDLAKASGRDVAKASSRAFPCGDPEPAMSGESWLCKRLCNGFKVVLGATGARRPAWDLEQASLCDGDLALAIDTWTETLAGSIHVTATGEVQIDSCTTAAGKVAAFI